MKKTYTFILCFLLSLTNSAAASSIIQNHTTGTRNLNVYGAGIGQTFLATSTSFSSISANLFPYPNPGQYVGEYNPILRFEIYKGLPQDSNPMTLLKQEEIDITSLDVEGGGTLHIDISSCPFTIGTNYSFALLNDTSYWRTAIASDLNNFDYYDQGDLFYVLENEKYLLTTINTDMQFTVTAAVPTPSTLLLLASGLPLLPIFRKKFRYSGK